MKTFAESFDVFLAAAFTMPVPEFVRAQLEESFYAGAASLIQATVGGDGEPDAKRAAVYFAEVQAYAKRRAREVRVF